MIIFSPVALFESQKANINPNTPFGRFIKLMMIITVLAMIYLGLFIFGVIK